MDHQFEKNKQALIQQVNQLLQQKDYEHAIVPIKELIDIQNEYLDHQECLEDQIELMILANNLYRYEHISQTPKFYKTALYQNLMMYSYDDFEWKMDKFQELLKISLFDRDFFIIYNVSFILMSYYRNSDNQEQLVSIYKDLFMSLKELEADLINYAKRVDDITLNVDKEMSESLFYRLNKNPIEQTSMYQAIKHLVDDEVSEIVGKSSGLGFCHVIWSKKKSVLKEKYGMEWHSPSDLNDAHFD
jgi:hypothetical protein